MPCSTDRSGGAPGKTPRASATTNAMMIIAVSTDMISAARDPMTQPIMMMSAGKAMTTGARTPPVNMEIPAMASQVPIASTLTAIWICPRARKNHPVSPTSEVRIGPIKRIVASGAKMRRAINVATAPTSSAAIESLRKASEGSQDIGLSIAALPNSGNSSVGFTVCRSFLALCAWAETIRSPRSGRQTGARHCERRFSRRHPSAVAPATSGSRSGCCRSCPSVH